MTATYKESCGYKNDSIFVESKYTMHQNEDLLVIVVKLISCSQRIFFPIPS